MITIADINQQINQSTASEPQAEKFTLTATIDTALCVGAGGSSGSLADKPILKTAQGKLVIPASQLKGRLRHECEKLARALGWPVCESPVAERMCPQRAGSSNANRTDFGHDRYRLHRGPGDTHTKTQTHCIICQLFGNPTLPSRFQLSDLVCMEPAENIPDVIRPGVTINRRRRTAEEQRLYYLETSPANAQLKFVGEATLLPPWKLANGELPTPFAKALLTAGFKHIHALGGGKSTGLGWLHWQLDSEQFAIEEEAWSSLVAPPSIRTNNFSEAATTQEGGGK